MEVVSVFSLKNRLPLRTTARQNSPGCRVSVFSLKNRLPLHGQRMVVARGWHVSVFSLKNRLPLLHAIGAGCLRAATFQYSL